MTAGQQLGVDLANNFMHLMLFSLIADMAKNPDAFRTDVRNALSGLIDGQSMPGVAPETAKEARDAAKQIVASILRNTESLN